MSVTIKTIRENTLTTKRKKQKTSHNENKTKNPGDGRYVKWEPGTQYVCSKTTSYVFTNGKEIDVLFKSNKLTDDMFEIYKNVDDNLKRNQTIPVYEATYKTKAGLCYKVQKIHLKQAYNNSKKTDSKKMWDFISKDVPYWVDRHIFSKKIN